MNLNLITSVDPTGYGYTGRFILNELTSAGVQVALFPLNYNVYISHDPRDPVRLGLANAERYDASAPSVRIAQARALAEHVGRGKHAGFPIFELDRFESSEVHHLKQMDAILVCSKWAAAVVASNGISVPIFVAPLGVDRSVFHEAVGDGPIRDRPREPGPTIFVTNGKWEWRKGHDFLLKAFCNAFTTTDNVILKLLSRNYTLSDQANDSWAEVFVGSRLGTKVQLVPRVPSQLHVAALLADCDCGVFPSRRGMEPRPPGVHVDGPERDCHQLFGPHRVRRTGELPAGAHRRARAARTGECVWGQGNWGKLGPSQLEQMVHHLREVHRLKQEGSLSRNHAGIATAKQFTWRRTAEAVLRAVA